MKKWIIAGVVPAVLAGLAGGGYMLLGGPTGGSDDGLMPEDGTALVTESAPVPVERGEIDSQVVLDATVRADAASAVEPKEAGEVSRLWVADGQAVEEGAPIVSVTVAGDGGTGGGDDADGGGGGAPATESVALTAPASGTVDGLDDLAVGDPVEPGTAVARITQDEFRAVAAIPPNDLYRFYDDPREIMLKIDQGPAAEACEFLSLGEISEETAQSGNDEEAGGDPYMMGGESDGGAEATAELHCRVPDSLQVFPGVQGKLSVVTGRAENALLVPLTALRGSIDQGEVIVVGEDGTEEPREVELGVSDGTMVEVTDGLTLDDQVLDPVPLEEEFDVPSESGASAEDGPMMDGGF
ncbi:efflux RND transporter periplasmic adaptor subunit [Nocardiopsis mangrovi]|uniref:Efflux RND transporter periplasmic adaptor subunit n=1 Tax=Nocardiopsis mangrovi TaxID=1179818 RepID=A0ABV9DPP8_9ACTN